MSNATVKHFRELFVEGNDTELRLSDDQILAIVTATDRPDTGDSDNDEDAFDTAVIMEMESQNGTVDAGTELPAVPPTNQEAADENMEAAAASKDVLHRTAVFADRAAHDETLMHQIGAFLDASDLVKASALQTYFSLVRIYGADMESFPVPGSKVDEKTNRPTDQYITTIIKNDGGKKQGFGYYYNDFFSSMEIGAKLDKDIAAINAAINKLPSAPVELMKLRHPERRALRSKLEQRRTAGRGIIKRAVHIYLQMEKMKQLPKLRVTFSMKDAEVINDAGEKQIKKVFNDLTSFPIFVGEIDDPNAVEVYNVQQFLSLNIDKAAKTAGGLDDLIVASQRGDTPDDPNGTDKAAIKDIVAFENVAASVTNYMEKEGTRTMFLRRFSNKKDGDAFILLVGDLITSLDGVWAHIEKDYNRLSAEQRKRDSQTATDKARREELVDKAKANAA